MSFGVIIGPWVVQQRLPLLPRERTSSVSRTTSEKCQQETHALQQNIIKAGPPGPEGNMPPLPRSYSILTATLNVLPLTVCSCNVAALWRLPGSALLVTGSVIVAIAPISARSPNGPGAKRL